MQFCLHQGTTIRNDYFLRKLGRLCGFNALMFWLNGLQRQAGAGGRGSRNSALTAGLLCNGWSTPLVTV